MNNKTATILLVEDNDGDVELVREAMQTAKILNTLHVAATGEAALDFVYRRGGLRDAPRPDMIILDLNLPGISGREVLSAVKTDPDLRPIPVIVMTTSRAEEDVLRTYLLHANCYITKPVDMQEFINVVQRLDEFWFEIVRLPPAPTPDRPDTRSRSHDGE